MLLNRQPHINDITIFRVTGHVRHIFVDCRALLNIYMCVTVWPYIPTLTRYVAAHGPRVKQATPTRRDVNNTNSSCRQLENNRMYHELYLGRVVCDNEHQHCTVNTQTCTLLVHKDQTPVSFLPERDYVTIGSLLSQIRQTSVTFVTWCALLRS